MISIINPLISVIISGLMFLTALLFYRRSRRLVNKTKYLVVYPVFNFFRNRDTTLKNNQSLSIPVYVDKKMQKLQAGTIVRLEKHANKFFLLNKRFLRSNIEEELSLENYFLSQTHLSTHLTNESENSLFLLNRSYHKYIDELVEILDVEIQKRAEFETGLNNNILYRIKNMFKKIDTAELKTTQK